MPFANSEYNRTYWRRYRESHKEDVDSTKKQWRTNNPEKRRAQNFVNNAVRDGRMTKGSCEYEDENCTPNGKMQGHHDDYDKPEEVRWLCPWHHKQVDLGKLA
jgi:major membrane immunogen (membrane-anchored lipoprotein)